MAARRIERKLWRTADELRRLRAELAVADDQHAHMADEVYDAATRALVSDSTEAGPLHREAKAHADAMHRYRQRLATRIAELEARQEQLLDALSAARE